MLKTLAGVVVSIFTLIGLAGCSGAAPTPAASATSSQPAGQPPPAPGGSSGQSVNEACLSMAQPMAEASDAISKLASGASDPQRAVDTWTELVKAYQKVEASVTNTEVKTAVAAITKDVTAVRDAIKKVYVDKDTSSMDDFSKASQSMSTSLAALTKVCAG